MRRGFIEAPEGDRERRQHRTFITGRRAAFVEHERSRSMVAHLGRVPGRGHAARVEKAGRLLERERQAAERRRELAQRGGVAP